MLKLLKVKNFTFPRPGLLMPVLFGRRYWLSTLLVLAAVAVMVRLGFWQLNRLEQRRARNVRIARQLALPPLALTGNNLLPDDLSGLKTRRVTARGRFDFSRQVALIYQNYRNQAGIHLITPLLIEGSNRAVLVDRGWIPQADALPAAWPRFDEPGPVDVTGFIRLPETRPRTDTGPQTGWFRVDVAALQAQMPYELLPIYIQQSPPAGAETALPYRTAPEFDLSDGPHLGYAIQWYLFAVILAAGYAGYLRRETTGNARNTGRSAAGPHNPNKPVTGSPKENL